MSAALRLRAFAKINWSLEILGRRRDGYHEVRTVLQTIDWWDDICLVPGHLPGLEVIPMAGNSVPDGAENLVERARALYTGAGDAVQPLSIRLWKQVPTAAGLGGGSSDAATVLRGLDRLSDRPVGAGRLERLASDLGSDVPFFIHGGTQVATGRGEVLERLGGAPAAWLVVLTPNIAVERKTARMYSLLGNADYSNGDSVAKVAEALSAGALPDANTLKNTFDRMSEQAYPGIGRYRQALVDTRGHALLCGSGPALFALCGSAAEAEAAALRLRWLGMPARAVRTVTAAESTAVEYVNEAAQPDIMKERTGE